MSVAAPYQALWQKTGPAIDTVDLALVWESGQPQDWFSLWNNPGHAYAATQTGGNPDPFGGNRAYRVTVGAGGAYYPTDQNCDAMTSITGSFWAKSATGATFSGVPVGMVWNGGTVDGQTTINVTSDWQRFEFTWPRPASMTQVRLQIGLGAWAGVDMYMYRPGLDFPVGGSLTGLNLVVPLTLIFVHRSASAAAWRSLWGGPAAGNLQIVLHASTQQLFLLKAAQYGFATFSTTPHIGNAWRYSALTYASSGAYAWYLNGAADGGATDLQTFTAAATPTIGDSAGQYFHSGTIGYGMAYRRALSAADIAANYTAVKAAVADMGITLP